MKKIILLSFIVFSNLIIFSQDRPEDKFYHFAYSTTKSPDYLFISKPNVVIFQQDYDYKKDNNFSSEMQRQYLYYLDIYYYKLLEKNDSIDIQLNFEGYFMEHDKKEAKKIYKQIIAKFSSQNYKIIKVKNFRFD